ncbi:MAG: hypothetical protein L0213_15280, partial [Candidatus Dadabacteria bacterium]|nr:hypothetical protein [Candidatus Dadabacteria bacterium]
MSKAGGLFARVPSGSFQSGQLTVILKTAKKSGLTGEINISSREGDGFITLYKGYVATVFSPGIYSILKEKLTRQGLIGETQIKELLEIQKIEPNNILESRLIVKGFLTRESLCGILKSNSETVLRRMLAWSGLYRIYEDSYANVPEEILIDIDTLEGDRKGASREYKEHPATVMPYTNFSAIVTETAADSRHRADETIQKTLDGVMRRLGTFRPKEVVVVVDEDPLTARHLADGLIGFGFEAAHFGAVREALDRI